MKYYFINDSRMWSSESVRSACERNTLYTRGTCEDYNRVLNWVNHLTPSLENIFNIAEDIVAHSEGQTIANVMAILENEAVTTSFAIHTTDD